MKSGGAPVGETRLRTALNASKRSVLKRRSLRNGGRYLLAAAAHCAGLGIRARHVDDWFNVVFLD